MARSDVEALSRSFRSRIALLALLLAIGLGLALWTGTRKTGIGEPEDRRRIMVVIAGGEIDYHAVFDQAGFEIEVDGLDDWIAAARAELPDSKTEGFARVLELADQRGFALVVFELDLFDSGAVDFGGLELEPAIESIDRVAERDYAALSVGDFGFPHRLSVDDPGDPPFLRLPGYGALQAVFRQELIDAREAPERPTLAELQFEDAIRVGREMFERPTGFAASVASAAASVETTLADGSGARMLLPALSTGTPISTPDGGILLFHHELSVFSDNARTLEIEAAAQMQISWIDPTALAVGLETGAFELEPCASLAGGSLTMADRPRLDASLDGSAVAIGSAEGAIVWRKSEAAGCVWVPIARLDRVAGVVLAPRLTTVDPEQPSRSVAAGVEHDEVGSRVQVWALDEEHEPGERLEPQILLEQSGRRFESLAFIDDQLLAVGSSAIEESAEDRVYVLDRTRPGLYLSLPLEFFAEGRRLLEVFALASARELLLTTRDSRGRIELIRVRVADEAWREFLVESEGSMVSLTPEQIEAELLFDAASVLGLSVGSNAVLISSADGPLPGELTLLDLASGERRRLTDNRIRDYLPRLAEDETHATFVSLMRVNLSATPFSVPRVLALPNQ